MCYCKDVDVNYVNYGKTPWNVVVAINVSGWDIAHCTLLANTPVYVRKNGMWSFGLPVRMLGIKMTWAIETEDGTG